MSSSSRWISQQNIVGHHSGFYEETGAENPSPEIALLFQHCNYKNWFYHSGNFSIFFLIFYEFSWFNFFWLVVDRIVDHTVFVGRMNRKNCTDKFEPIIVAVTQDATRQTRLIVFTRLGDMQVSSIYNHIYNRFYFYLYLFLSNFILRSHAKQIFTTLEND